MLRFDEPVEASFGALRVFDERGREVQAGKPFRPGGDSSRVAVKLRAGTRPGRLHGDLPRHLRRLAPGVGRLRVHGRRRGAPAKTVDELLQGSDAGPVTSTAFAVVRAVAVRRDRDRRSAR